MYINVPRKGLEYLRILFVYKFFAKLFSFILFFTKKKLTFVKERRLF